MDQAKKNSCWAEELSQVLQELGQSPLIKEIKPINAFRKSII